MSVPLPAFASVNIFKLIQDYYAGSATPLSRWLSGSLIIPNGESQVYRLILILLKRMVPFPYLPCTPYNGAIQASQLKQDNLPDAQHTCILAGSLIG